MKKKLLTLLIFGALSASLIACGKEVQLNDNNVRAAKSIIKTVDAYLEGDIDADTAHEKIENEYYNIDEADENYIYFSSNALTMVQNICTGISIPPRFLIACPYCSSRLLNLSGLLSAALLILHAITVTKSSHTCQELREQVSFLNNSKNSLSYFCTWLFCFVFAICLLPPA